MDADFSHDPSIWGALTAAEDCDLVLARATLPAALSQLGSDAQADQTAVAACNARAVLGVRVRDLTGGFSASTRSVLETIDLGSLRADGYVFQIEVTYRAIGAGFSVREVPILFVDRAVGASKMSWKIALEAMLLVPRPTTRKDPSADTVRDTELRKYHPADVCRHERRSTLGATPQSAAFELTSSATAVEPAHALRRGRARTWREHAAIASVVGVPLSVCLCASPAPTRTRWCRNRSARCQLPRWPAR